MLKRHPHKDNDWIDYELNRVLGILERDGYLQNAGTRWAFRSFLLRDFWQRHILH